MIRRRLLAGTGTTLAAAIGGCLDEQDPAGNDEDEQQSSANGEDSGDGDEEDSSDTGVETVDEPIPEDPRESEPPYEIPEQNPNDERDEEYLGAELSTEPSLEFETLSITTVSGGMEMDHGDDEYRVSLVTDEADYDEAFGDEDDPAPSWIQQYDFDESVLVIVEGFVASTSYTHRWARVEAEGDGVIHLYGYERKPSPSTDDVGTYTSVLEVDRPTELRYARVSLTVGDDRRIHFNSTEGAVSTDRDSTE